MNKYITQAERDISDHLIEAFDNFLKLDRQHPDEVHFFRDGIHQCQLMIAARIARKAEPDVFPVKKPMRTPL